MNFSSWQEAEAFKEQYPQQWIAVLDWLLGIVKGLANHSLSEYEASNLLKQRFESLALEHVSGTAQRVAAYQQKLADERFAQTEAGRLYFEKQQRLRELAEKRAKELQAAQENAVLDARKKEEKAAAEHRAKFEAEQRKKESERDREEANRAAAIEEALAKLESDK